MTDPISDYLTRLRNAIQANHRLVEIPASNMKKDILNYKFEDNSVQGNIKIALKYHPTNKLNAIRSLVRVSKPGLRKYAGHANLPKVMNGLGIAIISTSKGLMTDKEARNLNIGGEVICYIS
jgi:small subunit ribosomal protein S8